MPGMMDHALFRWRDRYRRKKTFCVLLRRSRA